MRKILYTFIIEVYGIFCPLLRKEMTPMKEGTLYKTLNIYNRTFEILYGYYEDYERESDYLCL